MPTYRDRRLRSQCLSGISSRQAPTMLKATRAGDAGEIPTIAPTSPLPPLTASPQAVVGARPCATCAHPFSRRPAVGLGNSQSLTQMATYPIIRDKGPLSKPTTAAHPRQREPLLMPLCGHSLRSAATADDAPLRHSFDAYFRRIIGSRRLSFARTMRRRRAPGRHDGHWGLAAGARAGAIRAGFPRERDRPTRPTGADGRRSERTWRRRDRPSPATAESDR